MLFIFSASADSSVIDGQAAANPSYVLRPNSKASLACSSASLNSAASSLKKGPDQWPGSSKTPSSDRYSVATSLMYASHDLSGRQTKLLPRLDLLNRPGVSVGVTEVNERSPRKH